MRYRMNNAKQTQPKPGSYEMVTPIPKPDANQIERLVAEYFDSEAAHYDEFDEEVPRRKLITARVNQIIADDLSTNDIVPQSILSVACGTGRRELEIRQLSGLDYKITGTDISPQMCNEATGNGLEVVCGQWPSVASLLPQSEFNNVLFLYTMGLLPSRERRVNALSGFNRELKHHGTLYFDVESLNDKYDWGSKAKERYAGEDLGSHGYEIGDVFYKKVGGEHLSFFHYCSEAELIQLLGQAGFETGRVWYIGYFHRSGEIVDSEREGSLLIKARKTKESSN